MRLLHVVEKERVVKKGEFPVDDKGHMLMAKDDKEEGEWVYELSIDFTIVRLGRYL